MTMRKASFKTLSMKRVCALRHQTGAQYSAAAKTKDSAAVRSVLAPAPHPQPASRLRSVTRVVPQESVLTPVLFDIYIYDLSSTTSRKYAYADDLALLHSSKDRKGLEETLSQDMATLSAYLKSC